MKSFKLFLLALSGSVFFMSCDKEELPTFPSTGNYSNGFLVVNEGTSTVSTISYVKSNFSSVANNIFAAENPSATGIGGYVQSIFFNEGKAYIIAGSSNKITVVDRYTFKVLGTVDSGFANPRYGVVTNGKAYITNSDTYSFSNAATGNTDDYISVINLTTLQVESTIPMNALADKIELINGKLYVTGGFGGEGNTLNIIDPATNTIVKTLTFGSAPNSMEVNNGKLYVLCSNYTDDSQLVIVDLSTDMVESTITLASTLDNAQNLDIDNSQLYFTVGNKVYSNPITATAINDTPLFTSDAMALYGFKVKGSAIYIADAKDYISNGQVLVYGSTGALAYQISVGLVPNGFYFNE